MILVLDNRDSFTFNLVQALLRLGVEVTVRRSQGTTAEEVRLLAPDRILVGPGPGSPAGSGCSLEVIRGLGRTTPVLGVCLGHQAIAAAFGGRVTRARTLVHGGTVEVEHDGQGIFAGLPHPLRSARYNSLTVAEPGIPDCLHVSARAADGDVMGLRHREWPLEGVQFHPESVLSEGGARLLGNFLAMTAAGAGTSLSPLERA